MRPSTPKNLVVSPGGPGEVVLSWSASNDNVGVTGYSIIIDGANVRTVTGTDATVAGVTPGTHRIQVQAVDAAGNRSYKTPEAAVVVT